MTKMSESEEVNILIITLRAAQAWILREDGRLPSKEELVRNMIEMLARDDDRLMRLFSDHEFNYLIKMMGRLKDGGDT